jgi:hypothetical protein
MWLQGFPRATKRKLAIAPVGNLSPANGSGLPVWASSSARFCSAGLWPIKSTDFALLGMLQSCSHSSCCAPTKIFLSRMILGGFTALIIGSSVCFARMAVEQITRSGLISDRLRYIAIIFAACLPRLLRDLSWSSRPGTFQLDLAWRNRYKYFIAFLPDDAAPRSRFGDSKYDHARNMTTHVAQIAQIFFVKSLLVG